VKLECVHKYGSHSHGYVHVACDICEQQDMVDCKVMSALITFSNQVATLPKVTSTAEPVAPQFRTWGKYGGRAPQRERFWHDMSTVPYRVHVSADLAGLLGLREYVNCNETWFQRDSMAPWWRRVHVTFDAVKLYSFDSAAGSGRFAHARTNTQRHVTLF